VLGGGDVVSDSVWNEEYVRDLEEFKQRWLDPSNLASVMAKHEWAWLAWTDKQRGHDDERRMEAFRSIASAIVADIRDQES
jgi:hypothetical protein